MLSTGRRKPSVAPQGAQEACLFVDQSRRGLLQGCPGCTGQRCRFTARAEQASTQHSTLRHVTAWSNQAVYVRQKEGRKAHLGRAQVGRGGAGRQRQLTPVAQQAPVSPSQPNTTRSVCIRQQAHLRLAQVGRGGRCRGGGGGAAAGAGVGLGAAGHGRARAGERACATADVMEDAIGAGTR